MSKKKRKVVQVLPSHVTGRDVREEFKQVELADKHGLPLYEVVSGNTTLDLTRFFKEANHLFEKYATVRMYRVVNGYKSLFRVKRNGTVLMGDLDALGHAGA